MYKDHPLFQQISNDTKIWRYLNKEKICSLLQKKSLFFAKASVLKDAFEGRYPHKYPKSEGAAFGRAAFGRTRFGQSQNYIPKEMKDLVYICSFTINEYESEVLWKNYLQGSEGAAIQTTLQGLKSCFDASEEEEIFIGKVDYLDYNSESFNEESNLFYPFLHKKVEYIHESELRAITTRFLPSREKIVNGIFIPISLQNLLEKIVLSPSASKDFEEQLTSLCTNKGLENMVIHSTLEDKPKW
ncbi:MAG: hypothetical protein ABSG28_09090 [Methanoregula sp.]|jgi:hypothetical protein|uniref:hypothetical protein n=1 Tax=Methanoregula sp. TaxID=2052170 RepID=UPI003C16EADB